MSARAILIAVAALMISGPTWAEPPKVPAHESAKPQSRPAEVIMASADQVQDAPAQPDQQNAAPVKRPRVARVTSCRCGDPQAPQDEQ